MLNYSRIPLHASCVCARSPRFLRDNECILITGPSGSGKSVLATAIRGLSPIPIGAEGLSYIHFKQLADDIVFLCEDGKLRHNPEDLVNPNSPKAVTEGIPKLLVSLDDPFGASLFDFIILFHDLKVPFRSFEEFVSFHRTLIKLREIRVLRLSRAPIDLMVSRVIEEFLRVADFEKRLKARIGEIQV